MTDPITMKDIATEDDDICGLPGAPAGGRCLRTRHHNDGRCATVGMTYGDDGKPVFDPIVWDTVGWEPPAVGRVPMSEVEAMLSAESDTPATTVATVADLAAFLEVDPNSRAGILLTGLANLPQTDRDRIRTAYPRVVRAWELVQACYTAHEPAPNTDELRAWLAEEGL